MLYDIQSNRIENDLISSHLNQYGFTLFGIIFAIFFFENTAICEIVKAIQVWDEITSSETNWITEFRRKERCSFHTYPIQVCSESNSLVYSCIQKYEVIIFQCMYLHKSDLNPPRAFSL